MRVFRRKRTDATTGKTAESGRWYVTWADQCNNLKHTWPVYTDRRASEGMGRRLETISARRASGEQLDADLRGFIDGLPPKRRLPKAAAAGGAFTERGRGRVIRDQVDGTTWALVYRLVMQTGLRSAEVRALTAPTVA